MSQDQNHNLLFQIIFCYFKFIFCYFRIIILFAIGCNKHFDIQSGADASITNSNSNFGQISLSSEGFKRAAFAKDNHAFVTHVLTPKSITSKDANIDWIALDVTKTKAVGVSSHLYIYGYDDADDKPPTIIQGYRVGAQVDENEIFMLDGSRRIVAHILSRDMDIDIFLIKKNN